MAFELNFTTFEMSDVPKKIKTSTSKLPNHSSNVLYLLLFIGMLDIYIFFFKKKNYKFIFTMFCIHAKIRKLFKNYNFTDVCIRCYCIFMFN